MGGIFTIGSIYNNNKVCRIFIYHLRFLQIQNSLYELSFFKISTNMQVNADGNNFSYYEGSNVSLGDVSRSSREKYIVPQRKFTQVGTPLRFLSQSFPPNCPISDDYQFNDSNGLSTCHTNKFIPPQLIGTSCFDTGGLRKRSNENKFPQQSHDDGTGRARSKSYLYQFITLLSPTFPSYSRSFYAKIIYLSTQ